MYGTLEVWPQDCKKYKWFCLVVKINNSDCILGLNSGVMLMDLERMRDVGWTERMADYYEEYKLRIPWGDQDLINIFFHDFPGIYTVICMLYCC